MARRRAPTRRAGGAPARSPTGRRAPPGGAGRAPAASPSGERLALLDQLDPVAVRVAHEADAGAALPDAVGRLLRVDALVGQRRERLVEVVDRQRDVVVTRAELVGVDAEVVGELEPVAVAGTPL